MMIYPCWELPMVLLMPHCIAVQHRHCNFKAPPLYPLKSLPSYNNLSGMYQKLTWAWFLARLANCNANAPSSDNRRKRNKGEKY